MNKRKIIYVDASFHKNNKNNAIGLYDVCRGYSISLNVNHLNTSSECELYAIYYAFYYIIKFGYKNCHVLSDSLQSANNKLVRKMFLSYNIGLSWIPREINTIADDLSKSEPVNRVDELSIVNLLFDYSKVLSD